jgi:hypothetical protein
MRMYPYFSCPPPEIHYAAPVTDPWFSAQKDASEVTGAEAKTKLSAWKPYEPLSVMGCIQQVQYCIPNLPEKERCEPLRGIPDPRASGNVRKIFRTEDEFAMINRVHGIWVYGTYTVAATVDFIGASALRARQSLSYGYSAPLSDNQWQLEAEHLIKGSPASLQDVFFDAANGMPEALEEFRQAPLANETVAQNICANQKIVSNNYSSFNVLGLSLIMALGMIIVMLDIWLEPAVRWFQHRNYRKLLSIDIQGYERKDRHPMHAAIEWSQTNFLQFQRLAHEEAGYGNWSGCDQNVPVTELGQLLSSLD